jgi:hypothetical protein
MITLSIKVLDGLMDSSDVNIRTQSDTLIQEGVLRFNSAVVMNRRLTTLEMNGLAGRLAAAAEGLGGPANSHAELLKTLLHGPPGSRIDPKPPAGGVSSSHAPYPALIGAKQGRSSGPAITWPCGAAAASGPSGPRRSWRGSRG